MPLNLKINTNRSICEIVLEGRIDGMTAPDIERKFTELTTSGERQLLVNFTEVNYISSAGLRVFLDAQKKLMAVGGELLLYKLSPNVQEVFRISGFQSIFKFFSRLEEIEELVSRLTQKEVSTEKGINGIVLVIKPVRGGAVPLSIIGRPEKVKFSEFTTADLLSIKPGNMRFGTGLAAVGESVEEVSHHLGETIILNNSIYFYPATKRAMPDFIEYSPESTRIDYQFLHGFGYSGEFKQIVSFVRKESLIDLNELIETIQTIEVSNLFGIVLIAESKGHKGMNLKKVPLQENNPTPGQEIFARENLSEWINFSVDPEYSDHVLVITGIICKDKSRLDPKIQAHFPAENTNHLHSAIFSTGLINTSVESFDDELKRILRKQTILKVQHTLCSTRFSCGIMGITQLIG